ncbi:hypothetical protein, partial [Streptomyces doudnae]
SGPGAISVRDHLAELTPDHGLYDAFTHPRCLGEKDLSGAIGLGDVVGVDLPWAHVALQRLADGLGVPHKND